jgi:hypothetical protein
VASVLLDPPSGRQGSEQVVIVRGTSTDFTGAECTARFPGGEAEVLLARAEAVDRIRLVIAIPAAAPEGPATLELATPAGTFEPEFTILPAESEISARFVPDAVVAGYAADLLVEGSGTAFEAGVTGVSFEEDSGIVVLGLDVESPTRLRVWLDVPAATPPRDYAASISTRSQVLGTRLDVLAGAGASLSIEPPGALQGAAVTVRIRARDFAFGTTNEVLFRWNPGITVVGTPRLEPATATAPEQLLVDLELAADARPGPTELVVVADGRESPSGTFLVVRAGETPTCTFLSTVHAGDRHVPVQVIGRYTAFVFDRTGAEASAEAVTVEDVVVGGPATILLVVSVEAGAAPGPVDVTFNTGTDVVSCPLTIDAASPASLTLTPDVLTHPADGDEDVPVVVRVTGVDLLAGAPRLAAEPGSGIAVRSLEVADGVRGTAMLRLSRDAPYGSSTMTLTAGGASLQADVTVVAAEGEAPSIVPGYVLLDGVAHDLAFGAGSGSFLDEGTAWPAMLRAGAAGLEVSTSGAPADAAWPFAARPGISLAAGHYTIAAHGHVTLRDQARHLAARVTGVGTGGAWAAASPSTLRAGSSITVRLTASTPVLDAETLLAAPRDSGLVPRGLVVTNDANAFVTLEVDQTAVAGDHVLVLLARGIAVPAVVTVGPAAFPPGFGTRTAVVAGATAEVELTGTGAAWNASTQAVLPAADPDLSLGPLDVTTGSTANLLVTAAAAADLAWRGGHVVWMRTGNAVAPGLLWVDTAPQDLLLQPGWLHKGRDETVVLSGADLRAAVAVIEAAAGVEAVTITGRTASSLTLTVRASAAAGERAVLAVDAGGTGVFVPLVLPVVAAPPGAQPETVVLPRVPAATRVRAVLSGLDLGAGVSVRAVGHDLYAGPAAAVGLDEVGVDVSLDLDAPAGESRWLVFLTETDAAAVRVLPGGESPAALPLDAAPETVSPFPGAPTLRALAPGIAGLAAIRATCADPAGVALSLLAPDGVTILARSVGSEPFPFAVPGPAEAGGAAFLTVETTVPTVCTLGQATWLEFQDALHDLESNDDPGEEELVPLGGALPYHHLARLGSGYDVDRYVVDLPRAARIEVFAGLPDDFAARTELALEVVGPDGTTRTADPWDGRANGVAAVTVDAAGRTAITVRAVAGSHGPYVLSLHEPVLLDELDLWSGGPRFVELAAAPGTVLGGWRLVHRSASGTVVAEKTLAGSADNDGSFVVAAGAGAFADDLWTALDAVSGSATLALVDAAGRDVDVVGLAGAPGEGGRLDPPSPTEIPTSLGRCSRLDTNDNRADFWRQARPTPGAPNACGYR